MVRGKGRRFNPYRRVRQEGGSAVLTVGAIIPLEWGMVKLEELERPDNNTRIIKITKVN